MMIPAFTMLARERYGLFFQRSVVIMCL
jgi:hypothetical protein